ncbi:hypothetical protein [Rhizobium mongolense]|uniref:Uncharacterized protein n=1 Tax=Rhizobium mongolense TaxID=57676 RepID=A0A7W6RQZ4_9HYPH|nr:hypothetical protein [Rhizobium mongolense]MBB4277048.1 hypothetical protein [Rhizobium mongolense]
MRRFSEADYLSLKRVLDVAYEMAGGNTLFQHVTRVVVSQLSKYASTDDDCQKTYMPIDVAIDLDLAAKSPIVTAKMAELLGYRLEPLKQRIDAVDPLSEKDALSIMDEATALWQLVRSAYSDGRIDALEKKQLRLKLHQLLQAAQTIISKLDELDFAR